MSMNLFLKSLLLKQLVEIKQASAANNNQGNQGTRKSSVSPANSSGSSRNVLSPKRLPNSVQNESSPLNQKTQYNQSRSNQRQLQVSKSVEANQMSDAKTRNFRAKVTSQERDQQPGFGSFKTVVDQRPASQLVQSSNQVRMLDGGNYNSSGPGEASIEQSYYEYTITETGRKKKKKKKKKRAQVTQGDTSSQQSVLPPQMPKFTSSHKALLKLQSFKKFGTLEAISENESPPRNEAIQSFFSNQEQVLEQAQASDQKSLIQMLTKNILSELDQQQRQKSIQGSQPPQSMEVQGLIKKRLMEMLSLNQAQDSDQDRRDKQQLQAAAQQNQANSQTTGIYENPLQKFQTRSQVLASQIANEDQQNSQNNWLKQMPLDLKQNLLASLKNRIGTNNSTSQSSTAKEEADKKAKADRLIKALSNMTKKNQTQEGTSSAIQEQKQPQGGGGLFPSILNSNKNDFTVKFRMNE